MTRSGGPTRCGANATRAKGAVLIPMLLAGALAGCARPGPDVLTPTLTTVPGAEVATIYAATTRARAVPDTNIYTNVRSATLNYAEFKISIPPGHRTGNIEWPSGTPDPAVSFATVQQSVLDRQTFDWRTGARDSVSRADPRPDKAAYPSLNAGPPSRGVSVGVFVHGFNTNFQEALYRLAQLKADSNVDGVPIVFAWPSEAKVTGYVADKDAAAYSRDQLVDVLTMLAHNRNIATITVFAHSMGGWLTVEALRQLRVAGKSDVISRLNVVLAAPDIDIDVFHAQMEVVGPLSPPLTVLVSRDDLALSLSSRIADRRKRVGALNVDDPSVQELAAKAKIEIIDISSLQAPDPLRHDRFAAFAALYPCLTEENRNRAGAFVFDNMGATLAAPFSMTGRILSGE